MSDLLQDIRRHQEALQTCRLCSDLIPLPHPSGASVWHRKEQGKTLLDKALILVGRHPAWREILGITDQ